MRPRHALANRAEKRLHPKRLVFAWLAAMQVPTPLRARAPLSAPTAHACPVGPSRARLCMVVQASSSTVAMADSAKQYASVGVCTGRPHVVRIVWARPPLFCMGANASHKLGWHIDLTSKSKGCAHTYIKTVFQFAHRNKEKYAAPVFSPPGGVHGQGASPPARAGPWCLNGTIAPVRGQGSGTSCLCDAEDVHFSIFARARGCGKNKI